MIEEEKLIELNKNVLKCVELKWIGWVVVITRLYGNSRSSIIKSTLKTTPSSMLHENENHNSSLTADNPFVVVLFSEQIHWPFSIAIQLCMSHGMVGVYIIYVFFYLYPRLIHSCIDFWSCQLISIFIRIICSRFNVIDRFIAFQSLSISVSHFITMT